MRNSSGWKTLGVASKSRIWVTADSQFLYGQSRRTVQPYSLAMSGQTAAPSRNLAKLASSYGRNLARVRRVALILLFALTLNLLTQNLNIASQHLYLALSLLPPQTVFTALLIASLALWVLWYKLVGRDSKFAFFVGALTLVASSVAVNLFRTLPLGEAFFEAQSRASEESLMKLNAFASVKNPLKAEKRLVLTTYRSLALLIKMAPGVSTLPCPQTTPARAAQAPAVVRLPLRAFQVMLKSPSQAKAWPTLAEALAAQPTLQALHLFQWQSIHASAPQRLRTSLSLWHMHKLSQPKFKASGLAALTPVKALVPQGLASGFAPDFGPSRELTTYLQAPHRFPIRFDMMQPLRLSESRLWGVRPRAPRPGLGES